MNGPDGSGTWQARATSKAMSPMQAMESAVFGIFGALCVSAPGIAFGVVRAHPVTMQKPLSLLALSLLTAPLIGACATAVPPVEATRFHNALAPASLSAQTYVWDGVVPTGIEDGAMHAAVARELQRIGLAPAAPGAAAPVTVRVTHERMAVERASTGGPVSVGLGGSTGSYGSGVGLGIGINLGGGGGARDVVRLSVRIDRPAGTAIWEGRAETTVKRSAPAAEPGMTAAKLAEALFRDFPGQSGATITVP